MLELRQKGGAIRVRALPAIACIRIFLGYGGVVFAQ
jgi:hypothetical protein